MKESFSIGINGAIDVLIDISAAIVKADLAEKAGFRDKTYSGDSSYFEDIMKLKLPDGLSYAKILRVLFVHN